METLAALRQHRWEVGGMDLWSWQPEQAVLGCSTISSYLRDVLCVLQIISVVLHEPSVDSELQSGCAASVLAGG